MKSSLPNQELETIKELYRTMRNIQEGNSPEVYLMPTEVYNSIMKKIIYLEDALKNARNSNEMLREKLRNKSEAKK